MPVLSRAAVIATAAAIAVSITSAGCARTIPGTPNPAAASSTTADRSSASDGSEGSNGRPELPEPPDGSGFSRDPLDQPNPIPEMLWKGWPDACAWIDIDLAAAFGATGPAQSHTLGCTLPLAAPDFLQIAWLSPYRALSTPTRFIRPVTIAGLQARQYALPGQGAAECAMHVNTRSTTSLHLVIWNPTNPDSGDRETRCATAARIAETAVTRFVPAAGGTAWPGTPQRPTDAVLAGASACRAATKDAAALANLTRADGTSSTSDLGTICTHHSPHAQAEVLLASRPLADLPAHAENATGAAQQLAGLPGRIDHIDDTCAVTAELAPQVVLRVLYRIDTPGAAALACRFAEVLTAAALGELLRLS